MRVAIVGAGISGVVAGAHLGKVGLCTTLFERNDAAGGVWLYDERLPLEPSYPANKPSEGDSVPTEKPVQGKSSQNGLSEDVFPGHLKHAPPGPCYERLSNNVSTRLLELTINPWKAKTPDFVGHHRLNEYIQETSRKTKVHDRTVYNTRVEDISKKGFIWQIRTSTLSKDGQFHERVVRTWEFEAVVIASGHYHACRIPNIPGLAEWKFRWPHRIQHSKSYRNPRSFKGQNVLLIGAGVSSTDIAREIGPEAEKIYQVSRSGTFDLPATLLPPNATRIGDIASFEIMPVGADCMRDNSKPLPWRIFLKDGQELADIHRIILCTGYHISLPFMAQYHSDDTPVHEASSTVLVTDGTQVHNLHKDIFYIPDPTLIFIGVPYYTATFTLFEFQAMAAAAVLSNQAFLPTREEMRAEYQTRVETKGVGKAFHSLKDKEVEYVDDLVSWINRDAAVFGAQPIEGHTQAWHLANADRRQRLRNMLERT